MGGAAGAGRASRADKAELALAALAIAAVALTLVLRILAARGQPLTTDETFTLMITSQHALGDFIREARRDVAAPLYYTVMHFLPVGMSDTGMRLPSWAFMIAGSALPLLWRIPNQPRSAAIAWAALLFLWLPGAIFAVQARPYALLFLTATGQTIAFAQLMEEPSLRRAFVWTATASLTLLTHYMSAPLGLAQGLVLLFAVRGRASRLWPSLLVLLIPLVEAGTHYRQLTSFASSDANWLPKISFSNVGEYLTYGLGPLGFVLLLIALASRYLNRSEAMPRGAALASSAGAIALAILIGAGWHRSLIVDRYLTACAPALMLALVTIAATTIGRLLLVAVAAGLGIFASAFAPLEIREHSMEWAVNKLVPYQPKKVVFSLANKGQETLAPETGEELGAVLFRRAGVETQARLVPTMNGRELIAAADKETAIIWVFSPNRQPLAKMIARQRRCYIAPMQLACPPRSATP